MQLDIFGATEKSAIRDLAPLVVSSAGEWIPPETVAFNTALRGGSLGDAVAILNRLKDDAASRVLLASGFSISSSKRPALIADVQSELVDAARLRLTGMDLREVRRAERAGQSQTVGLQPFDPRDYSIAFLPRVVVGDFITYEDGFNYVVNSVGDRVESIRPLASTEQNNAMRVVSLTPDTAKLAKQRHSVERALAVQNEVPFMATAAAFTDLINSTFEPSEHSKVRVDGLVYTIADESTWPSSSIGIERVVPMDGGLSGLDSRALMRHEVLAARRAFFPEVVSFDLALAKSQVAAVGQVNVGEVGPMGGGPVAAVVAETRVPVPAEEDASKKILQRIDGEDGMYVNIAESTSHAGGFNVMLRDGDSENTVGGIISIPTMAGAQAEAYKMLGIKENAHDKDAGGQGGTGVEARFGELQSMGTKPAQVEVTSPDSLPAKNSSRVIQDAGEELVHNRRNRIRTAKTWSDISHLNDALKVKEAVKANIWPKPDYKKLIAGGMQPTVAHIVKQVYDSIAVKPMLGRSAVLDDEALQRYIGALKRVEAGLMRWATDSTALKQWAAANVRVAGAMLGRVTSLSELAGEPETLLNSVYPGGWRTFSSEMTISGGNKLLAALQPGYDEIKRAFKALKTGWPEKREAWEIQGFQVVENPVIEIESAGPKSDSHFLSIDNRYVKNFPTQAEAESAKAAVRPYALFGKRGFVSSFDTEEEAVASAKERSSRENGQIVGEKGVRVGAVERDGVSRRMAGEDVSSERLVSEFGLKGVNFGNWMKNPAARAEAQLHLNHAFDSLHDLAEILGVPPKAMSLNGMLGLAFGAQGSGGSFAAHFVPGVNEINLTRTSGAGSLAHEWAHAVDHYYAVQGGLATMAEPFLTEHASRSFTKPVIKQLPGGGYGTVEVPRFGELRPEIVTAFSVIVESMNKRLETEDEAKAGQGARLEKEQKGIAGWLKAIRRDFGGQEEAFDVLAARVQAGDVGEGMVAASRYVHLSPVVAEIRELYKAKHGRIYSLENSKSLQAWVSSAAFRAAKGATDESHIPQETKSDFAKAALALDKDKGGKPYWSTTLEKFARAFDSFVSDELETKQAKNGYLSHTGRTGNTVPMGDERLAVNAAFRGLVSEVKVRETERGTAMFSAGRAEVFQAMPMPDIHAEIRRLRGQWPSMPPVTVVKSVGELPFESPKHADGAYCDGQVFVVAGNISDLKQLQKVMAHECVMHHSLAEMLGGYGFSKLHHGIQKLKESGDPVVVALAANIRSRYGELPPEIETKEIVARAGEQCLDDSGQVRVSFGFMKSVFAGVAGWLRDHGISVPFTNTELQGLMHDAGEWIKREEPGHAQAFGPSSGVALNSFGGVRAETAPLDALRLAREMHISGEDDRVIWKETGWTFGFADGKPRFEISDDRAEVILEGRTMGQVWMDMAKLDAKVNTIGQFLLKYPDSPLTHEVNSFQGVRAAYEDMTTNDPSTAREIENYLAHAGLFSAYPELATVKAAQPGGIVGLVSAGAAAFISDVNLIKYSKVSNADQFKSVTLHELQHAIQKIEGFAPGGSPQLFKEMDLTDKELSRINRVVFDLYERNPEFYRDSVKATQLQLKVSDKYGTISDGVVSDPLVQEWWAAIDQRDSYPEANEWFSLKSLERQVTRDRVILSPMDQYKSLAGEVEARLTQTRIDMSPAERLAGYPLDDMEVAVPRQVLRSGGKSANLVAEGSFIGKVLDVVDGVATQKVNRDGDVVRHLLSRLSALVGIGEVVEIAYKDGVGVVGGKGVEAGVSR